MGLGRLLQRIALVDFYLDLAGEHDVEQILRHRHQIGALGSIGVERRAREEEERVKELTNGEQVTVVYDNPRACR